jgi:uncharacterized protein (TIGR03435 family)
MRSFLRFNRPVAHKVPTWIFWGLLTASLSGQAPHPTFEVATIKAARPDTLPTKMMDQTANEIRFRGGPLSRTPDEFEARGVTLRMLVAHAYAVPPEQVLGPDWIGSQRFDAVARVPARATAESFLEMQQQLLAERFHLVLRREVKKLSAYRLTVSKEGHKLMPPIKRNYATAEETQAAMRQAVATAKPMPPGASNRVGLADANLDEIAARLAANTDCPVKNATGLKGNYSFHLDWSPKDADGFRDAIKDQLGLLLDIANVDLDVLVVEQASKVPLDN